MTQTWRIGGSTVAGAAVAGAAEPAHDASAQSAASASSAPSASRLLTASIGPPCRWTPQQRLGAVIRAGGQGAGRSDPLPVPSLGDRAAVAAGRVPGRAGRVAACDQRNRQRDCREALLRLELEAAAGVRARAARAVTLRRRGLEVRDADVAVARPGRIARVLVVAVDDRVPAGPAHR